MTRHTRLPTDNGRVIKALATLLHAANDLAPADDPDRYDAWRALALSARSEWDATCDALRRALPAPAPPDAQGGAPVVTCQRCGGTFTLEIPSHECGALTEAHARLPSQPAPAAPGTEAACTGLEGDQDERGTCTKCGAPNGVPCRGFACPVCFGSGNFQAPSKCIRCNGTGRSPGQGGEP